MAAFEYGAAIKITFDLPIITELPVVIGVEDFAPRHGPGAALLASGSDINYPLALAFDGSVSTYWRAASINAGQWIGKNFGRAVTLTKVGVRMDYASGRINAYKIQGSTDGTIWVDVAAGNFLNASGMQYVTFTAATYQYWRVRGESKFSTYYSVTELTFYGTRIAYDVTGWSATGYEPSRSPEGSLIPTTYVIRKITKTDDDYAVILWLDLRGRLKHPQGLVTIAFNGSLAGPGNAMVAPFTLTFTPANIAPVFNPNGPERIGLDVTFTAELKQVFYEYYQNGAENISLAAAVTATLIHINDLEN